jgi:dTDP-glucose 4,6-dehydratase
VIPRYVFAHGSIGDTDLVTRLLAEHQIDAIVNFAAESHVDRSIDSPEPFVQTNVVGTLRLLNCARLYWAKLPDGEESRLPVPACVDRRSVRHARARPTRPSPRRRRSRPNSPYAASKAASDHFVRSYQHTFKLPTLTTNCSNNYGPYHFPEKLIPLMILNALEGKPLPVYGDGMQIRDWLYVEDHAAAIWLVLQRGRVGETYNVGGLNEQPNIAIVKTICALLDRKSPRADGQSYASQITYVADRPGHDRRYAINCTKLQSELGWAPRESFATGIEKTVEWYLQRREWAAAISRTKYSRERLGTGATG